MVRGFFSYSATRKLKRGIPAAGLHRTTAVSLIEVCVTMGLFLVFLVAAGGLIRKASLVLRFSEKKSSSLRAMTFAMDRMTRELRGAQEILAPKTGSSSTLKFQIVDPSNVYRLGPKLAPPNFPILDVNASANMITLSYSVLNEALERVASRGGGNFSKGLLADRIQSLDCLRRADNVMELRIRVKEESGLRTLSTVVPILEGVP